MAATDSLKHVVRLFQIFGFSPFSLKKTVDGFAFEESPNCCKYTRILITAVTTIQVFGLVFFLCFVTAEIDFLEEISQKMVFVLAWCSAYLPLPVILRLVLSKRTEFCHWLNKLKDLLADLSEREFEKINRLNAGLLTLNFAIVIALPVAHYGSSEIGVGVPNTIWGKLFKEISISNFYIVEFQNKLIQQYFFILVNMLHSYYKETNSVLKTRDRPRKNWKVWTEYVRDLRRRELEVQGFLGFLHRFFIPVVSLHFLWGFYSVFINLILSARFGVPALFQVFWAVTIFWDCFAVSCLCHVTECEAEKLAQYVQIFFIHCDNFPVKEEVELLSLQVQHQKVEFYTTSQMKINLALIHTMIGSLMSYGVIFLQFKDDNFGGEFCYKKVNCSSLLT